MPGTEGPPYGMFTQLQPVIEKTHACAGLSQAPAHSGVSASPHDVARHSQEPVPAAAPQRMPPPQVPVHWPSAKLQPAGWMVVVVPPPPAMVVVVTTGAEAAGMQTKRAARKV